MGDKRLRSPCQPTCHQLAQRRVISRYDDIFREEHHANEDLELDGTQTVGKNNGGQRLAAVEYAIPDGFEPLRESDGRKGITVAECIISDGFKALRERNGNQGVESIECIIPNGFKAIRQRDRT